MRFEIETAMTNLLLLFFCLVGSTLPCFVSSQRISDLHSIANSYWDLVDLAAGVSSSFKIGSCPNRGENKKWLKPLPRYVKLY